MTLFVILYIFYTLASTVDAELLNPIFSEIAFAVNTTDSSNIYNVIYSTAATVSCQDFQAVLINKKEYNPTNRVLLNFGYGCENTTIDSVYQMNFNTANVSAIQNMEAVALVKRGACNWSEKLSVISNLSASEQMNVTAALIYDNQTHQDITIKTALYQATVSFPEYSIQLPSERSALNMTDNDITQSSIGVYFVPYVYGNTLKSKLNDTYNSSDPNIRTFWSITTHFPQNDSSNGSIGSIRGYFAYIIALAAIFLFGIIFLRWWKLRCVRNSQLNATSGNNTIHLQQTVSEIDPLPVDIVNSLPVKQYEMGLTKNANCPICIDDFLPGKTDLRILPCGHGFCVLCIDPWLTQKSTLCPICKWDCLPPERRQENEMHNLPVYTFA